jgi:hypothetical protein
MKLKLIRLIQARVGLLGKVPSLNDEARKAGGVPSFSRFIR